MPYMVQARNEGLVLSTLFTFMFSSSETLDRVQAIHLANLHPVTSFIILLRTGLYRARIDSSHGEAAVTGLTVISSCRKITAYDELSVSMCWRSSKGSMRSPLVKGSAYISGASLAPVSLSSSSQIRPPQHHSWSDVDEES
jgi:hypothetical protein